MTAGQLKIVRVMANPKRKAKRRKNRKLGRGRVAPKAKRRRPSEMVMRVVGGRGKFSHYEWWTGSGWARQKTKGKRYYWREELNAAWLAACKNARGQKAGGAVMTVPA